MNLSEVRELKEGDEIECSGYLPKITWGKKYLTCDDYGTCTQIAGLRHWGGFCVKKRDE